MSLFILSFFLAAPTSEAVVANLVIKVPDPKLAAKTLIDQVNLMGGYFSSSTDNGLVLKVPHDKTKALIDLILPQGILLSRQYSSEDLGQKLVNEQTRLRSRQEVLVRYQAVLAEAGARDVVTVEKEIISLVQQIEELKGSLRHLAQQIAYATVTVSFQFRERAPPRKDGRSSFEWLNHLNLEDLREDFAHD